MKTVQKKVVVLVDDRDGSVAEQTISFAFKGVSYEIDLSKENAEEFERVISPCRRAGQSAASESKSSQVRRWAREKGISLSERGRIPTAIIEQFEKETR